MDKAEIKKLEQLNIELDLDKAEIFDKYARIFLQKNSRINLISKNDAKLLFEKHIFDSLAINLFLSSPPPLRGREEFQDEGRVLEIRVGGKGQTLLDIGTGGGFPSVPIALFYDDIEVFALDSIKKKIKVIEEIKDELNIINLFPICDRVENTDFGLQSKHFPLNDVGLESPTYLANSSSDLIVAQREQKFDYITTRAVSSLDTVLKYAIPHLKKGGYFIAYKSKKTIDELKEAEKTIKKLNIKLVEIIEYKLPLEENHERNLIIFQTKN